MEKTPFLLTYSRKSSMEVGLFDGKVLRLLLTKEIIHIKQNTLLSLSHSLSESWTQEQI